MPDIQYVPISRLDESAMLSLMKEEERMWLTDLGWDYSIIQQILLSFISKKMLPGYAALDRDKQPAGYIYFLVNQARGNIGALYTRPTTPPDKAQEIADGLVELAIACFRNSGGISRVEAQILPFHGQNYAQIFKEYGFHHYPRVYLVRNIDARVTEKELKEIGTPVKFIPWDSALISRAAAITTESYLEHGDYEICEDYRTQANCENYLSSLVTNPGCGVFLPEASFMCVDGCGDLCGYVICSRISGERAMMPQITVHPKRRGRGLGDALMSRCLRRLHDMNFRSLSLTVTKENFRACEWYRRLGFQTGREFGAFIWNRT